MSQLASIMIDVLYALAALFTSPVWLYRMIRTGKIRTDWPGRFGRVPPDARVTRGTSPEPRPRRVLIHAVSVGEANAVRRLVDQLADSFELVVASTTNTGFQRASELYSPRHAVVRYPLDFSFAVRRFLRSVEPDAVVLVELEVWPNLLLACRRRKIPACIVNGRLSAGSFRGYRRIRPVVAPVFRMLSMVAAQDEQIAERFRQLGVPPESVRVVPTMKWDNATIEDDVPGAEEIAQSFGIDRARPVVVAGSTADGEEALIHSAVPGDVQLIVAPRKPERFDEAAAALPGCVRRSACRDSAASPGTASRFLLDTIGELRAAYALADLVIVGRTFAPLGGSDMIEPVSLGKPTVLGPDVENFESVMKALRDGAGVLQVSRDELRDTVTRLLSDPQERRQLAERGRDVVRRNQGSVAQHADLIANLLAESAELAADASAGRIPTHGAA